MIGLTEHLEFVQYGLLLTESARTDFLIKTYAQRLAAKWEATGASEPGNIQAEVNREPGDDAGVKLLNFILSHDPSRVQGYTQWMTNRYLKGGIRLEDMERCASYLTVFDAAKTRIKPADINAYKTLPELFQAVQPFIEGEAVSARQQASREDRRMHQEDRAQVLLDTATMKIVVPLTKEAAIHFGRNTQWCTAATDSHNYFESYNERGPLYIVLDKKTNRRWQWHFEDAMFMDERDDRMENPSFPEFVRAHPEVIKAIGEQKFVKQAVEIGLDYFSPRITKLIGYEEMIRQCRTLEQFYALPREMQSDPAFVTGLVEHNYSMATVLPANILTDEMLLDILKSKPNVFGHIQDERLTQEMVNLAPFQQMTGSGIKANIPSQFWTPAIKKIYYEKAVKDSHGTLPLAEVPEEYRTEAVCTAACLHRHQNIASVPEEIMTPEFALYICLRRNTYVAYMPDRVLSPQFTQAMYEALEKRSGGYGEVWEFLKRATLDDTLSDEFYTFAVKHNYINFSQIPESKRRDADLIVTYIDAKGHAYGKEGSTVPDEYLTPQIVANTLTYRNISAFPAKFLTPEIVRNAIRHGVMGQYLADALPEEAKTPEMLEALVAEGCLPIAKMPESLLTPENVIARIADGADLHKGYKSSLGKHLNEIKDIPESMMTPEFAHALVERMPEAIHHIPKHLISEPIVHHALKNASAQTQRHYSHSKENLGALRAHMEHLPREKWTPRIVAYAIHSGVLEASFAAVPAHAMSPAVAAEVLRRSPDEFDHLPKQYLNSEAFRVRIAGDRSETFAKLTPEQITPAVAKVAVKRWAASTYTRDVLADLDRSTWDEETWMNAVGYIATLGEVPKEWRSPAMIENAITRDASNVSYLDNPAAVLKQHNINITDKRMRQRLEDNGLIFKGKDILNVRDLDGIEVPGGKAVPLKLGPNNKRLYVIDDNGNIVGRLETSNGKIKLLSDANESRKHNALIARAASQTLASFSVGDLESIGIFELSRNGRGEGDEFFTDATAKRETIDGLTWSLSHREDSVSAVLWNGDKAAMHIDTYKPSGGWGRAARHQTETINRVKVYDRAYCLENAPKVYAYMAGHITKHGDSRELAGLGIITPARSNERILIRAKQIAKLDGFSVWTNADRSYVGLFSDDGMIAYAKLRASGRPDKVQYVDPYHENGMKQEAIDSLMAKVGEVLANRSLTAGTSVPKIDGSKIKAAVNHRKPTQLDLFKDQ